MSNLAPIAIQLYTLRDALAEDFAGIVTKLAEIGYVGVEPTASMAVSHAEAAKLFTELGLAVTSIHAPLPAGEDKDKVLEMAQVYGLKRIVMPYMPAEDFKTADSIKQVCDALNEANVFIAANGLEFGYHNHWAEFEMVDDTPAYKIMLEHLDPAIFLELDTYWAQTGGQDPVAVVAELGERAPLLHIKDGPADAIESFMVAVGDGVLDVPGIIKSSAGNADWLIVELDRCATDMMVAVEKSYEYLVKENLGRGNN